MADDDNDTNEQCELVLAYENMLDMFAESYSYSFDAYIALFSEARQNRKLSGNGPISGPAAVTAVTDF